MALTRYEPWGLTREFDRFARDLNNLLDRRAHGDDATQAATSDWAPAVDIKEEADHYLIQADLPGVKPEDVDVTMEKGVLVIKGQRNAETKEERDNYKRVERVRGTFYRSFALPDTADVERISARSNHGVLEITIPKQPVVQPRKIEIQH
jgi:HSP20 family protein